MIACRIARRSEVDIVRAGGLFGPGEYAVEDLVALAAKLGDAVKLDAGHAVRKWEDVQAAFDAGCVAFQTTNPPEILDSWKAELARRKSIEGREPA